LLKAAELVFARDGFEAAKLGDIASWAGYTRGAFYANFASKEDLFIEMLIEQVGKRMAELRRAATAPVTPGANLRAMRDYYIQSLRHPTWNVLFLEYKLFSLRHPRLKSKIVQNIEHKDPRARDGCWYRRSDRCSERHDSARVDPGSRDVP
jgi:AcrR family transcriptional regulator